MKEIRTVLFDAGNTLLELDYRALSDLFLDEGVVASPGQVRETAGRARPAIDAWLRRGGGSTESEVLRARYLDLVLDALGLEEDARRARLAEKLAGALSDLWYVPAEGAEETLGLLRNRGLGVGVVSNSDGRCAEFLDRTGLLDLLDTVVDSGREGVEKPDPGIFRIALSRLGARAESALHVGDLPSIDVAGARAAGLAAVLLDPFDVFPDEEVRRIRSLPELPPLID